MKEPGLLFIDYNCAYARGGSVYMNAITETPVHVAQESLINREKCFWREDDGVIYFDVLSPCRNPDDWVVHFTRRNVWFGPHHYVRDIILLGGLHPTNNTYTCALMRASAFPQSATRAEMDEEASRRGFCKPTLEIACMLRDAVSEVHLALLHLQAIVTMHEPVKVQPRWLEGYDAAKTYDVGALLTIYEFEERSCLGAHFSSAPTLHKKDRGFAYVASHTGQ
jgi:hypothetical protein